MKESLDQKRKRALKVLQRLKKAYPDTKIALNFKTPMQLLAAVILSAQATDNHVNSVTTELFRKYKIVDDFASANLQTFTKEISSINFYKNKAKFIVNSARILRDEYGGKIPNDINELVKLPGVARKTANIVQYQVHGKAEGVPVDTHVKRVSYNLGLTKNTVPDKIEKDLMELYPQKYWGEVAYYFQAYGRTVMKARGKADREDPIKDLH